MGNSKFTAQQVLNRILNLTNDAICVEGESSPDIVEKLNTIISLMGRSSTEKEPISHDLQAGAFSLTISPDSNWTPKFLALTFSSDEVREVSLSLRYGTDNFLIREFVDSVEQQQALSIWFTDFGINPFIDSDMSLVLTISQTSGACTVTGVATWDEVSPTV